MFVIPNTINTLRILLCGILLFAVSACGGGSSLDPFSRKRADGKIPVQMDLIRQQVRKELDSTPEDIAEKERWQTIEEDFNNCRLSKETNDRTAQVVFDKCMSDKGYLYLSQINAEQLHDDIYDEEVKERESRLKEAAELAAKEEDERKAAELRHQKEEEHRLKEAAKLAAKDEKERILQKKQRDKDSNLIRVVLRDDAEKARALLKSGASPDALNDKNLTALMIAAGYGHAKVAKVLLGAGANLDTKDDIGFTALMIAVAQGHTEVTKALLDAGANLNIKLDSLTALMFATSQGHTEIVKTLLDAGANPDIDNDEGWTALMFAADENNVDAAKALLDAGANLHAKSDKDRTALMIAVSKNNTEVAVALLNTGANPDTKNDVGFTALMIAVSQDNAELAKILLNAGARLNVISDEGVTALIVAIVVENSNIAKILLSCGANPKTNDALTLAESSPVVLAAFYEYQRKIDSGWQPKSCKRG